MPWSFPNWLPKLWKKSRPFSNAHHPMLSFKWQSYWQINLFEWLCKRNPVLLCFVCIKYYYGLSTKFLLLQLHTVIYIRSFFHSNWRQVQVQVIPALPRKIKFQKSMKTTVILTFLGYFDSQMKIHLEIFWKQNRDS